MTFSDILLKSFGENLKKLTFSDILLKSFNENLKKLTEITKTNHFSILLVFSRKS